MVWYTSLTIRKWILQKYPLSADAYKVASIIHFILLTLAKNTIQLFFSLKKCVKKFALRLGNIRMKLADVCSSYFPGTITIINCHFDVMVSIKQFYWMNFCTGLCKQWKFFLKNFLNKIDWFQLCKVSILPLEVSECNWDYESIYLMNKYTWRGSVKDFPRDSFSHL